jgi:hypothetical protein
MAPLPWPAEAFLGDPAVRIALAGQKHKHVAFLILFASQAWLDDTGTMSADIPRLAAILGLQETDTSEAVTYWMTEGKLEKKEQRLYLPWLTRAKAARKASAEAKSIQASQAARARWNRERPKKGENMALLPASGPHADRIEWPKDYTRIACEVWVARWGSGSAPGDVIASNLRALKKGGAEWPAVLRSFQRYVDTVEGQYASPAGWRKRWRAYDPEEPEHDHEAAKVVDSMDRQRRQRARKGAMGRLLGE